MSFKTVLGLLPLLCLAHGGTLMEELTKAGATTVADLLKATQLDKAVEAGYLTLFAPTNEAFNNVPDDLNKVLSTNTSVLSGVLQFHATSHIFRSQDAFNDMMLQTELDGASIRVNIYNDNAASPLYITLNGARVVKADIPASNGIVHLIDKVMLPPLGNFYELVAMSAEHTILKSLIDEAGLKSALETYTGTLLAPTDAAFQTLNASIASNSVGPLGSVAVRETLMYHIVGNVVYSAGVKSGQYATLNKGQNLVVSIEADGKVKVNQATVIINDIPATNGVIHIIDSVLIPEPWATMVVLG